MSVLALIPRESVRNVFKRIKNSRHFKDIFSSPAFYIRQNDVIYVKPNKYKAQSGEINQNRSFYISLVSTAIAVATLIVTITK